MQDGYIPQPPTQPGLAGISTADTSSTGELRLTGPELVAALYGTFAFVATLTVVVVRLHCATAVSWTLSHASPPHARHCRRMSRA